MEIQGYRDPKGDLYPSFFSEIFLYLNDYRPVNDWRGILIFTKRRLDPGLPLHYQDFTNSPRFRRIYLDQLPEEIANSSLGLGVLQLRGHFRAGVPPVEESVRLVLKKTSHHSKPDR